MAAIAALLQSFTSQSQSARHLAAHLGIPVQRVNEIVKGKRGVSADTAWLLSQAFGTSPEFWANLQSAYDLSAHRPATRIAKLAG